MKVIDADILKTEGPLQLDVTVSTPTLGWTNVSLSLPVYFMPPIDGIQDVLVDGIAPADGAATRTQLFFLSTELPTAEWMQGVRIRPPNGDSLTVRTPVKQREPIGDDWLAVGDTGLKGDKLLVEVRYGGGCGQHSFQLDWDGAVIKTIPPQVVLKLTHNAHGDPCKALRREWLQFDLSVILDNPSQYVLRVSSQHTEVVAHHPRAEDQP